MIACWDIGDNVTAVIIVGILTIFLWSCFKLLCDV